MTWKDGFEIIAYLLPFLKKKKKPPNPLADPHRVLIVEDNPLDAEILLQCLVRNNCQATITHTAEGARELIARNNIDIAFIDMRLPHMAGWELVPLIWRNSPHTLVVVICGEWSDLLKISSANERHMMVMRKPPSVESISGLLSHIQTIKPDPET